jgi:hypothetical protein
MDCLQIAVDRLGAEVRRVDAIKKTAPRQPLPAIPIQSQLDSEISIRRALDSACAHWIETQTWRDVTPEASDLLWERICAAYDFRGWLLESGFIFPKSDDFLLKWLLIAYWERVGSDRWRTALIARDFPGHIGAHA